MQRTDLLITSLLPLHQDAAILDPVVREISAVLQEHFTHHEIILVLESGDVETRAVAESLLTSVPCVRMILLSRDFGLEKSLLAGLETSIGDYVVTLIPETDPPALIPEMVAKCRELDGMVHGVALNGESVSRLRRLMKRAFHAYCRRFLKFELIPGCTDFRVLSRRMVNALTQYRESFRQMRLLSVTVGYQRVVYPYALLSRSGRQRERSFFTELNEALDIIVAHSRQPLRFVSLVSWGAGFLNVLYVLYASLIYLFKKDVAPGWTTLSVEQGVMFFFLFSLLAILSEYVGSILEESRARPQFLFSEEKNSAVLNLEPERPNVVHHSS